MKISIRLWLDSIFTKNLDNRALPAFSKAFSFLFFFFFLFSFEKILAKRSEHNLNDSLYENVSYQNPPITTELFRTSFLYPK
jgi:hypothetical protein